MRWMCQQAVAAACWSYGNVVLSISMLYARHRRGTCERDRNPVLRDWLICWGHAPHARIFRHNNNSATRHIFVVYVSVACVFVCVHIDSDMRYLPGTFVTCHLSTMSMYSGMRYCQPARGHNEEHQMIYASKMEEIFCFEKKTSIE